MPPPLTINPMGSINSNAMSSINSNDIRKRKREENEGMGDGGDRKKLKSEDIVVPKLPVQLPVVLPLPDPMQGVLPSEPLKEHKPLETADEERKRRKREKKER